MRRRALILSTALMLATGAVFAQVAPPPERRVEDNRVISEREPKINITVPKPLAYAGVDRWNLYDVSDCEIHVFAETSAGGRVKRLIWIQFEGYLAEKPDMHYGYNSPRHVTLGGTDFFVDIYPRGAGEPVRAGSDREHMQALLGARGATLPDGMMYVRLVHLLDEKKRRELMIIYGEPLPDPKLSAADLEAGGKAQDLWPKMSDELVERAVHSLGISG